MPSNVLHLAEWTPAEVECRPDVVAVLQDTFRADVSPARESEGPGRWRVRPSGVVGLARVGPTTVVVRPRIPVRNVLLLAVATRTPWAGSEVSALPDDELHLALARLYVTTVERTLAQGVLRGYRGQQDFLSTVRGRIDLAEQIRRHPGRAFPLAVTYQEHDEDVPENRIVKAAAVALARLGFDDPHLGRGLQRILGALSGVTPIAHSERPVVHWSRLNERYQPAVALAQLVLDGVGLDLVAGSAAARSLTLDMPRLFETFLAHELGRRLAARRGVSRPQDTHWWLDEARRVPLRPDLVWDVDGAPAAVIDAKYQSVGPRDNHGANLYQMLAYCTALDLPDGHLIYAHADSAPPLPVRVVHSGPTIHVHALDLALPFPSVLAQLDVLATEVSTIRERSPAPSGAQRAVRAPDHSPSAARP
ncbi:McrC family protein [Cellulosimicrobium cellulans]